MDDACALNADGTLKEAHEIDFEFSPSGNNNNNNGKTTSSTHDPPSPSPATSAATQPLRRTARTRKEDRFQQALRFEKESTTQPSNGGDEDDGDAPLTGTKPAKRGRKRVTISDDDDNDNVTGNNEKADSESLRRTSKKTKAATDGKQKKKGEVASQSSFAARFLKTPRVDDSEGNAELLPARTASETVGLCLFAFLHYS